MSLHGLRRQGAFALAAVIGLATSATAMAQQTSRSVDDVGSGGGSGFTVIEDAPRPTAPSLPPRAPGAYTPATISPAGTSGVEVRQAPATPGNGKTVKPGEAVYEIPFAKSAPVGAAALPSKPGAPSVAAPPPPPPKPAWEGKAPTDARAMLTAWAKKAGWSAIWDAAYTFPLPADVRYDGTFEQAVSAHYAAYTDRRRTKTPVCVDMHRNNRTVHVYQPDDSGKCDGALQQSTTSAATASIDRQATP